MTTTQHKSHKQKQQQQQQRSQQQQQQSQQQRSQQQTQSPAEIEALEATLAAEMAEAKAARTRAILADAKAKAQLQQQQKTQSQPASNCRTLANRDSWQPPVPKRRSEHSSRFSAGGKSGGCALSTTSCNAPWLTFARRLDTACLWRRPRLESAPLTACPFSLGCAK